MPINFTLKELEMLKESLKYSITKVESSTNYSHNTYIQKREKINQLQELKSKISEISKEAKK